MHLELIPCIQDFSGHVYTKEIAYDSTMWYYLIMKYIYPFKLNALILRLCGAIEQEVAKLEGKQLIYPHKELRSFNRILSLHASLSIEGNSLTVEQIKDLIKGEFVFAPERDILEVENALKVYDRINDFDALKQEDLLKAHKLLMEGLVKDPGTLRKGQAVVVKGLQIIYTAPKAELVSLMLDELFNVVLTDKELPWILKATLFHYELEKIHPFQDGNGRMGRLWQQLLSTKYHEVFEFVPVDVQIKKSQNKYYEALSKSDKMNESTPFIEFSLITILKALKFYGKSDLDQFHGYLFRLEYAKRIFSDKYFTRKDYLSLRLGISTTTANRDLSFGLEERILMNEGTGNSVKYKFI